MSMYPWAYDVSFEAYIRFTDIIPRIFSYCQRFSSSQVPLKSLKAITRSSLIAERHRATLLLKPSHRMPRSRAETLVHFPVPFLAGCVEYRIERHTFYFIFIVKNIPSNFNSDRNSVRLRSTLLNTSIHFFIAHAQTFFHHLIAFANKLPYLHTQCRYEPFSQNDRLHYLPPNRSTVYPSSTFRSNCLKDRLYSGPCC